MALQLVVDGFVQPALALSPMRSELLQPVKDNAHRDIVRLYL
jgi:hypothetical protein